MLRSNTIVMISLCDILWVFVEQVFRKEWMLTGFFKSKTSKLSKNSCFIDEVPNI